MTDWPTSDRVALALVVLVMVGLAYTGLVLLGII